jgi:glutathione reductase (NADPH)
MANACHLVVIGTGAAASAAAYRCREAGWRVEVINHLPFGGTPLILKPRLKRGFF